MFRVPPSASARSQTGLPTETLAADSLQPPHASHSPNTSHTQAPQMPQRPDGTPPIAWWRWSLLSEPSCMALTLAAVGNQPGCVDVSRGRRGYTTVRSRHLSVCVGAAPWWPLMVCAERKDSHVHCTSYKCARWRRGDGERLSVITNRRLRLLSYRHIARRSSSCVVFQVVYKQSAISSPRQWFVACSLVFV